MNFSVFDWIVVVCFIIGISIGFAGQTLIYNIFRRIAKGEIVVVHKKD